MVQHFFFSGWFITISPSDIDSPNVMRISTGEGVGFNISLLSAEDRARSAAVNPTAGALYFERLIDKAFECLFHFNCDGSRHEKQTRPLYSRKVGVLGRVIAHFIVN